MIIIEMNPRVSRSSALASKATGFPIARIAAKLALGYSLDEIPNDITTRTPSCFEPSIDYVVVKIPRFNFEKFPSADPTLGTQMKSVGEAMAFGRSFEEAFQKAVISLETGTAGLGTSRKLRALGKQELIQQSGIPRAERIFCVLEAFRQGATVEELNRSSQIDPWFLRRLRQLILKEEELRDCGSHIAATTLRELKRSGFSDARIAQLSGGTEADVRVLRERCDIHPEFSVVDTCAGEFQASTPYLYSSYSCSGDVALQTEDRRTVLILGSGPNRIGQGIEFDYCCVHAVFALQAADVKAVMVNCNPETVSTDYDVSDALYFEPLTVEHVLEIAAREKPTGIIVQFGGQTPLKLARTLHEAGLPILGTSVSAIEACEDRELFAALVRRLGLRQPVFGTARSFGEAREIANRLQFPLMIRPSFVLGGRAMRVVFSDEELESYFNEGVDVSEDRPVLLDRFLQEAIEVDVDAVCDQDGNVRIAGIMEHIERAGVHSGDSSCCLPPQTLQPSVIKSLREQTILLARETKTIGLINVQYAVQGSDVYVLEVNPRASRTIPFVSKATGVPWAQIATRVMLGETLTAIGAEETDTLSSVFVKACVFPFDRFAGVDTLLGPEMKSTGEVMGIGRDFAEAFYKSQVAAKNHLPRQGTAFLSVRDEDKLEVIEVARVLAGCGLKLLATEGTAHALRDAGIAVETVKKVRDGSPHIVDLLGNGSVQIVVNTPEGSRPHLDSTSIRLVANELRVPTYTTMAAARAAAEAIACLCEDRPFLVKSLQELHTI
jgi:carbamoyl-phosphate synthase large subunit